MKSQYLLILILLISLGNTESKEKFETELNISENSWESITRLKSDTLYIINRTFEGGITNAQMKGQFKDNYTHSAFRVLEDSEIDAVSKQPNVIHFTVVGQYYASEGSPLSCGIYLLDKDMKICERPLPYYTYSNGLFYFIKYLKNDRNTSMLIAQFNGRLGG